MRKIITYRKYKFNEVTGEEINQHYKQTKKECEIESLFASFMQQVGTIDGEVFIRHIKKGWSDGVFTLSIGKKVIRAIHEAKNNYSIEYSQCVDQLLQNLHNVYNFEQEAKSDGAKFLPYTTFIMSNRTMITSIYEKDIIEFKKRVWAAMPNVTTSASKSGDEIRSNYEVWDYLRQNRLPFHVNLIDKEFSLANFALHILKNG